jgi:hypothetical protein
LYTYYCSSALEHDNNTVYTGCRLQLQIITTIKQDY